MVELGARLGIVIGGGPAGLMAADQMARAGLAVRIYDRMPTLGRKFLLAGRGGLNLTHSEPLDSFITRYDAPEWLAPFLREFPPEALRDFVAELGEPTFVGSSGRVFPKSFKSSPLLRAWLRRLAGLGVEFIARERFVGFAGDGAAEFENAAGARHLVHAAATVLALGGASWPKLGATGDWVAPLSAAGVKIRPLVAANAGFGVMWSEDFVTRFAGTPLKTIALAHRGERARGDLMLTARGVEGGAVYALGRALRETLLREGEAELTVDLRPDVSLDDLAARLDRPRAGQSTATFLRKAAGLPPEALALLRETQGGPLPSAGPALAARLKAARLRLTSLGGLDRAISTAGGVMREACDDRLMLKALPGVFVAGEMLDWEAPTGGYLLQACFATGFAAGRGAAEWAMKSCGDD